MASDYYLDGIGVAVEEVRGKVRELFPEKPLWERDPRYMRDKQRDKIVRQRIAARAKEQARIPLKWRRRFAEEWKLPEETVVKATNIILRDLERALQHGHPIRISHLGSFRIADRRIRGELRPRIVFTGDRDWLRLLNPPTSADELGLRHRVNASGSIEPRPEVS
jgi:hypothetical protein